MKHWLFPSSWEKFDVLSAFAKYHQLDWRKNCTAHTSDVVFIYLGDPVRKIVLKTAILNDSISAIEGVLINDREFAKGTMEEYRRELADIPAFFRLEVIESYVHLANELSLETLRLHGLARNIQGPQLLENNTQLHEYILGVDSNMRAGRA